MNIQPHFRLGWMLAFVVALGASPAQAEESDWARSYALEAKGEYEKAAALMASRMGGGEASEFATLRYAWLNYRQGNFNDAIDAYKKAMRLNTRSIDAKLGVMLPLMAQRRWREAARYGRTVLENAPQHYIAHVRLMACEEGLRQWEQLERHAEVVATWYPAAVDPWVYLARARAWQGREEAAKSAYRKVLQRMPAQLEALRYLRDHP